MFQLTATLANNIESYKAYSLEFDDTLSKGLDYNNDAVIKLGEKDVTDYFTPSYDATAKTLTFTCDNILAFGAKNSDQIVVEYTAKLNENAVIGAAGNPNKVSLKFSNNPNNGGEGDRGTTPEDKVIVFTYKLTVNKVDKDNKHDESSDNPTLTDLTGDVASGSIIDLGVKLDKGELSTNVVNNKGSVLPSTGGAGRVAIYVIGAILVIGGGIVLVTKKRVR